MWFLFSAAVLLLIVAPVSWLFYTEFPWWEFRRKPEPEPVFDFHRDELSSWDDQFYELTGKTVWQVQCEVDPALKKHRAIPGTNDINPFYEWPDPSGLQNQPYYAQLQQQQFAAQGATWDQLGAYGSPLSGALSGSLGGLLGSLGDPRKRPKS